MSAGTSFFIVLIINKLIIVNAIVAITKAIALDSSLLASDTCTSIDQRNYGINIEQWRVALSHIDELNLLLEAALIMIDDVKLKQ